VDSKLKALRSWAKQYPQQYSEEHKNFNLVSLHPKLKPLDQVLDEDKDSERGWLRNECGSNPTPSCFASIFFCQ
jgi:hypothetical protein